MHQPTLQQTLDRFESKIERIPFYSCWLWMGAVAKGYGASYLQGGESRAHRIAWILYKGKIPGKLWVLHKCDNPICVNPDHLYLGNAQDNTNDMIVRGRDKLRNPFQRMHDV